MDIKGKINSVVYTYLESIITLDPRLNIDKLFEGNDAFFNKLGIDKNARQRICARLKRRYDDWVKYGLAENAQPKDGVTEGMDLTRLVDRDIETVDMLLKEEVLRVPITDVYATVCDGKDMLAMRRTKALVDLVMVEIYNKGDFGPILYSNVTPAEVKSIIADKRKDIHVWVYISIIPEVDPSESPERAF